MFTMPEWLGTGNHASRPAAGDVAVGGLYACSTHGLIYQTDGSSWATWATLGSFSGDAVDVTFDPTGLGNTASTDVQNAMADFDAAITAAGGGGGTPILRLDYNLTSDITNQAITAGTFFDLFANQNFTVGSGSSLIEVVIRGFGFMIDAAGDEMMLRINVDSAGTPVLKYFSCGMTYNASTNTRANALQGGVVYVSGLSAATHTIKAQVTTGGSANHFYCRAASAPPTGQEFLNVQVIEHP